MIKYKDILQSIKSSNIVDIIMDDDPINNDFIFSIQKDLKNEYLIKDITLNRLSSSEIPFAGPDLDNYYLDIQNEIELSNGKIVIFVNKTEGVFFNQLINKIKFKKDIILVLLRDINKTSNTMINHHNIPSISHSVFLMKNKKFKILRSKILPTDVLSTTILLRESKLKNIVK